MPEYANNRLKEVCQSAEKLPTNIEAIAMIIKLLVIIMLFSKAKAKRISTAKPAALLAVEKKATTVVGAPSYTSGVQI